MGTKKTNSPCDGNWHKTKRKMKITKKIFVLHGEERIRERKGNAARQLRNLDMAFRP